MSGRFAKVRHVAPATAPSTWTQAQLGDEIGNITENSASSVTLATQATNEVDNGLLAYQTISGAADIQVLAQVPATASWSGSPLSAENFTGFGLRIQEALTGEPVYVQIISFFQGAPTAVKHRLVDSGPRENNYATGDVTEAAPIYQGITYDQSEGEVQCWESPTGVADEYNMVGDPIALVLDTGTIYAALYGTSHDLGNQVSATLTNASVGSSITISDAGATPPVRNIDYELTYDGGVVLPRADGVSNSAGYSCLNESESSINVIDATRGNPCVITTDGAHGFDDDGGGPNPNGVTLFGFTGDWTSLNGTLVRPRNTTSNTFRVYFDHPISGQMGDGVETSDTDLGANSYNTNGIDSDYSSNGGRCEGPWEREDTNTAGFSAGDGMDLELGTSLTIGADVAVAAPSGSTYFMRGRISYIKDYAMTPPESVPHFGNSGKSKSRWGITIPDAEIAADTEFWSSVQFYIPTDFEQETGVSGTASEIQLYDVTENAGPSGVGFYNLVIATPNGAANMSNLPGNYAQWILKVANTDLKAQNGTYLDDVHYSLGAVTDDLGDFITFVFRARANPCGTGALTYQTATNPFDEGILGAVDLLYQPDTGVMQTWKSASGVMAIAHDQENEPVGAWGHDTDFMAPGNPRMYKHGWHHNNTTVTGPIEIGVGPFRYAIGTGRYSDVHPTQEAQP